MSFWDLFSSKKEIKEDKKQEQKEELSKTKKKKSELGKKIIYGFLSPLSGFGISQPSDVTESKFITNELEKLKIVKYDSDGDDYYLEPIAIGYVIISKENAIEKIKERAKNTEIKEIEK